MGLRNVSTAVLIETDQGNGNISTFSVPQTLTSSDTDRYTVLAYAASRGTERTIASGTYDGSAVTNIGTGLLVDGGRAVSMNLISVNDAALPATAGNYDLALTLSGGHGADPRSVVVLEFDNVNQTTPFGTEVSDQDTGIVLVVDTAHSMTAASTHNSGDGLICLVATLEGASGVSISDQSSLTNVTDMSATNANQLLAQVGYKVAASTSETIQIDITDSAAPGETIDSMGMIVLPIQFNAGAAPVLSGVNDDDVVHLNQQNTVDSNDSSLVDDVSVNSVNATAESVVDADTNNFTIGQTVNAALGTSVDVVANSSTAFSATLAAQEGWSYVTLTSVHPAALADSGVTLAVGDQRVYETTPGLTFLADGRIVWDTQEDIADFQHYTLDSSNNYAATTIQTWLAPDTTNPTYQSASINADGDELTVNFSENVDQGTGFDLADITLSASGGSVTLSSTVSGDGTSSHVYGLSRPILSGETVTLSFNGDADSLEDGAGNDLGVLSSQAVTNSSTEGLPTLSSATMAADGNSVTYVFSEPVTVNNITGLNLSSDEAPVTLSYTSGSGTDTIVCATSRTVYKSETVSTAYTQPGNGIEDAVGLDLASFSAVALNASDANRDPAWATIPTLRLVVGSNGQRDVSGYVSDPDGDSLTFSENTLPGVASIDASGLISGIDTSTVATFENNQITADDGDGGVVASNLFTIEIVEMSDAEIGRAIRSAIQSCIRSSIKNVMG